MTVKELIKKLESLPQEMNVLVSGDSWYNIDNNDECFHYEGNIEEIVIDNITDNIIIFGQDDWNK